MTRRDHYFAFGSNLDAARMTERVPSAQVVGAGVLEGWRFVCNKTGLDGSAKANIEVAPEERVWGVVYRVAAAAWPHLDRIEGGYLRLVVVVEVGGHELTCQTYASERTTDDPTPFDWYKRLMVDGARAHGLPPAHIAMLDALPSRPTG